MVNALISVVKGGKVLYKIYCGCNGYIAYKVAKIIKVAKITDYENAFSHAQLEKLGCKYCLHAFSNEYIVSANNGVRKLSSDSPQVLGLQDPKRVNCSDIISYVIVVDLDKKEKNADEKTHIYDL